MASAAAKRPRQISHHARRWPTCGPTIKTYGYRPTSVLRACMHVLRAGINFYSTCPTSLRPRNNRPRCQITRSLPACLHACGHIALCEHNRTAAGLASGTIRPVPSAIWGACSRIKPIHEPHFPRLFGFVRCFQI